jgi:hypothetical protein
MQDSELGLVVSVLGQALMRRAYTDLAAGFSAVDPEAAERAVRVCEALLSEQLAMPREERIRGMMLSERALATVSSTLRDMRDAAFEQIRRERMSRH